jgi:peptide/nickel transport system substrate-binding protein
MPGIAIRWAALGTIFLLLAACTRNDGTRRSSDSLVIGVLQEPDRLDPLLANTVAGNDVFALAFDGLVRFDRNGTVVPDLALTVPSRANGGISLDGLTLIYRLRRDVRWQDGVPFGARDVVFTWRALVDRRNLVPAHGEYDHIASVTAPDAWTVRVRLREPYAPAVALFAGGKQGAIVPAHALEGAPDLSRSSFEAAPVGTGPYRVVAWHHGDSIELERSRFARGRHTYARLRIVFFGNEQGLSAAVRTGEVDVALGFTVQTLDRLRSVSQLRVRTTPTYEFEHLTFNVRRGSGPQSDPIVRRAFARAIDVSRYARAIYFRLAGLAPLDQAPWSWARANGIAYYAHDPTRARRELLAAGYKLPVPLTIVTTAGNDTRTRLEVAMQSDLAAGGFTLSIKNAPANLMLARQADGGILTGGRFQVALFVFAATSPDPNDERYVTSQAIPPNGINMAGYANADVDRLAREAAVTYDRTTRAGLYAHIQRILIVDLPLYTLAWIPQAVVTQRSVEQIDPVPIGSPLWQL